MSERKRGSGYVKAAPSKLINPWASETAKEYHPPLGAIRLPRGAARVEMKGKGGVSPGGEHCRPGGGTFISSGVP